MQKNPAIIDFSPTCVVVACYPLNITPKQLRGMPQVILRSHTRFNNQAGPPLGQQIPDGCKVHDGNGFGREFNPACHNRGYFHESGRIAAIAVVDRDLACDAKDKIADLLQFFARRIANLAVQVAISVDNVGFILQELDELSIPAILAGFNLPSWHRFLRSPDCR